MGSALVTLRLDSLFLPWISGISNRYSSIRRLLHGGVQTRQTSGTGALFLTANYSLTLLFNKARDDDELLAYNQPPEDTWNSSVLEKRRKRYQLQLEVKYEKST